jgi:hypothetical protein
MSSLNSCGFFSSREPDLKQERDFTDGQKGGMPKDQIRLVRLQVCDADLQGYEYRTGFSGMMFSRGDGIRKYHTDFPSFYLWKGLPASESGHPVLLI